MNDLYVLENKNGAYGFLEMEEDFDILKLSDFTLEEAVKYLSENNIEYRLVTGIKGTLYFKSDSKLSEVNE